METGFNTLYTGAAVTRADGQFSVPRCVDPNTNYVESFYQALWVLMNDSNSLWLETGTGHECNGRRYWYHFACTPSSCGWLGTTTFATTATHTFSIQRIAGTDDWQMRRDGTVVKTVSYGNTTRGSAIHVGLESHSPSGTAGLHKYSSLKYATWDGALQYWAGFDNRSVNAPACGGWNTATEWRAKFPASTC